MDVSAGIVFGDFANIRLKIHTTTMMLLRRFVVLAEL